MSIDQLKALWQRSFGDPEDAIDAFFSTAYSPARCQVLMQGD